MATTFTRTAGGGEGGCVTAFDLPVEAGTWYHIAVPFIYRGERCRIYIEGH